MSDDDVAQCTWQQDVHRCVRDLGHRWAHMDAGAADAVGAYRADAVGVLRRERAELNRARAAAGYRDPAEAAPQDKRCRGCGGDRVFHDRLNATHGPVHPWKA